MWPYVPALPLDWLQNEQLNLAIAVHTIVKRLNSQSPIDAVPECTVERTNYKGHTMPLTPNRDSYGFTLSRRGDWGART